LSTHLAPPRSMASGLCSPNDHATFLQAFDTPAVAEPKVEESAIETAAPVTESQHTPANPTVSAAA